MYPALVLELVPRICYFHAVYKKKPNKAPNNQNQYTECIKVTSVARTKGSLMTANL